AAVDVHQAADLGRALGGQGRHHQGAAGADVGGVHRRAAQGPAADLEAGVVERHARAGAGELLDVGEAVRVDVVGDVAEARDGGQVGGERRLQVGGHAREHLGLDVGGVQRPGGVDGHLARTALDLDAGGGERLEHGREVLGLEVGEGELAARGGGGQQVGGGRAAGGDGTGGVDVTHVDSAAA